MVGIQDYSSVFGVMSFSYAQNYLLLFKIEGKIPERIKSLQEVNHRKWIGTNRGFR